MDVRRECRSRRCQETKADYEAGNARTKEENSAGEGFRQWSTKSGIGTAQPCLRKYLTGGNARKTEISPVQSRRRSLGFYKIRKNGAPVKRGCRRTKCAGYGLPDR